ncbi:MAG TPA: TIGR04086 family membrane protein [Desulfotomaculum sp.]|nr:MAG: hypothetical protein JL56_05230 [Desulfotomaculum sp. BICA1-6]HBX22751.1 TIGR04086 family membrane protein [Desulfotomaculum sp.]
MSLKDDRAGLGALNFSAITKGILIALVITVLGSALLSVVYQMTGVAEKTLPATSVALFYVSILVGSFLAARDAGSRGLLHGIVVAILFMLLGLLLAGLFFDFKTAAGNLLLRGGLSGIAGAVGGVLGVGLSR